MKGVVAADIGTDHALLPVSLVRREICPKVYACDISEGPLASARKTIAGAGLQDQIEVILSDGFDHVPMDTECAVIAGMGYYTAAAILEKASGRLDVLKQIIVEVNRNVREMREWISSHGFTILDEAHVSDRGFDYIIISFNTQPHAPYTETELECGPVLMQRGSEAYYDYCSRTIAAQEKILAKMNPDSPQAGSVRKKIALWQEAKKNRHMTADSSVMK